MSSHVFVRDPPREIASRQKQPGSRLDRRIPENKALVHAKSPQSGELVRLLDRSDVFSSPHDDSGPSHATLACSLLLICLSLLCPIYRASLIKVLPITVGGHQFWLVWPRPFLSLLFIHPFYFVPLACRCILW